MSEGRNSGASKGAGSRVQLMPAQLDISEWVTAQRGGN